MKTIHKQSLDPFQCSVLRFKALEGIKPLTMGIQDGRVAFWYEAPLEGNTKDYVLELIGTGHYLDETSGTYVGTVQYYHGTYLVLHGYLQCK